MTDKSFDDDKTATSKTAFLFDLDNLRNRTSQEEGLAPAVANLDRRGQAPLPDLFISLLFISTDFFYQSQI